MEITVDMVKALREQTGAGVMDCKRALEEAGGDVTGAEEVLKSKGLAAALKKVGRETKEGLVEAYIHSGGRLGAVIELNCETDFVARTEGFKDLAHNLAMQVAAMSPLFVDGDELKDEDAGPPEVVCLMEQPFIKDSSRKVREIVQEEMARVGENIRVGRFTRYALGE